MSIYICFRNGAWTKVNNVPSLKNEAIGNHFTNQEDADKVLDLLNKIGNKEKVAKQQTRYLKDIIAVWRRYNRC